jgi:hypothetical protein
VSSFEIFGSLVCQTKKREFPPVINQEVVRSIWGNYKYDVPDGIVKHLARVCGGNVHDRNVVEVTSSKAYSKGPGYAGKNITDMVADSFFCSDFRDADGKDKVEIPPTRNNWVCYDFKERRIVPTHYALRTSSDPPPANFRGFHLRSWLVEVSENGKTWREVDNKQDNEDLDGESRTRTFPVAPGDACRFIKLVQIGRNQSGDDRLWIEAWEIFGTLIE